MPAGMFLKSEGFASSLADPIGHYTLPQFCDKEALPVFRPGNSLTKSGEFLKDGISGSSPHERA
jgi:hypothetical protein